MWRPVGWPALVRPGAGQRGPGDLDLRLPVLAVDLLLPVTVREQGRPWSLGQPSVRHDRLCWAYWLASWVTRAAYSGGALYAPRAARHPSDVARSPPAAHR